MVTGYTGKKLKKYIQGEKSYLYFDLACRRDYKNAEDKYDTDWITFVAYNGKADVLDGVEGGTLLTIEATIRSYEKMVDDSSVRKEQSLVVEKIHFLNSPKVSKENQGGDVK